jgi:hypothetical protein
VEDALLGPELYRRIMGTIVGRIEERARRRGSL